MSIVVASLLMVITIGCVMLLGVAAFAIAEWYARARDADPNDSAQACKNQDDQNPYAPPHIPVSANYLLFRKLMIATVFWFSMTALLVIGTLFVSFMSRQIHGIQK